MGSTGICIDIMSFIWYILYMACDLRVTYSFV